jgi:tellurite resistance protein
MLPLARPEPFWSRPSPALLPPCLGLIATGLVWREAVPVLGAPEAVAGVWIGAALAVLAVCLSLYVRRAAARPQVLLHDLRMPAGRGAVPAGSMALMLAGAALAPLWAPVAMVVWGAGVVLHGFLAAVLLRELAQMPPDARPATAPLLVPFAGEIVAPLGGVPLGFGAVSAVLFWLGLAVWAALLPLILRRLWRAASPPPPVRPGTAVLLAPPAIGAVALERLDPGNPLVVLLFVAACVTLIGLLARARWVSGEGFSPAWGAFTFPLAAFAGSCLVMAERFPGAMAFNAAAAAVTVASLMTLYVAGRIGQGWLTGRIVAA